MFRQLALVRMLYYTSSTITPSPVLQRWTWSRKCVQSLKHNGTVQEQSKFARGVDALADSAHVLLDMPDDHHGGRHASKPGIVSILTILLAHSAHG